jgi:Tfp pilus assembly protein PilF
MGLSRLVSVFVLAASLALGPVAVQADETDPRDLARFHWQRGYALHVMGLFDAAAAHFRQSIAILPTAEGHTFLGWSLSRMGRLEEAIGECRKAIPLDPDYGNPYNDIGAYLIELDRPAEAVPWLEKAMRAKRYCCYQFPYANLGRVLLMRGRLKEAERAFRRALDFDPDHEPALQGLDLIRRYQLRSL